MSILKIALPLMIYLSVSILAIFLPASNGYDTIVWKLLIGQIYAVPALIATIVISLMCKSKDSNREEATK